MKGDFSRLPRHVGRYSGVWMQQGRVQLDQDWNEQLAIESERSRAALRDLVGGSGAPAGDPGFRVRARGGIHCGGGTVLEADVRLDVVFGRGELTVEVRVRLEEDEEGGVLVEVEGLFALTVDGEGRPALRLGGGDGVVLSSPEALPRGVPVLVSAAYDGRVAVLHLDGRPVAAAPVPRPGPFAGGARLRMGGSAGRGGEMVDGFGGSLDEVRLWSHARTPAQVREAAGRTLTGKEEGLAAYYPLDEGEGKTAHDAASGRHARAAKGEPGWKPHELMLGSGRFYVDGVPCVAPQEVPFDAQPDLPGVQPLESGRHLLYLDVWERYLSASEDPALREVALGGLDTTGRTRTVWQVRAVPLGEGERSHEAVLALKRARRRSALAARRTPAGSPAPGNRLYRVEVHGAGGPYGWPRPAGDAERAARVTAVDAAASGGGGTLTLKPGRSGFEELLPGARVEIFTRATEQAKEPGTLAHVTAADPAKHQVTVDTLPTGLSVSDEPRVRAVATFLWSEDNAWQSWPVRHLERATGVAVLGDVGPEGVQLSPGDLVELSDDQMVLLAQPGLLRTVKEVDLHAETVTLDAAIPAAALTGAGRPLLRKWSRASGTAADALPVRADQWTGLSDGVEVRFEGTAFRTTDYWTIPMRVAAPGGLEWPQTGNRAAALPPQGIEHRYAALATVTVHPHRHHHDRHRIEVEDHRRLFEPLTALTREEHRHPHDGHHHAHGEVDVTVVEHGPGGEVIVSEHEDGHGDESVDVRVDGPGADVEVHVEEHPHHPHHHPHEHAWDAAEEGDGDLPFLDFPDAEDSPPAGQGAEDHHHHPEHGHAHDAHDAHHGHGHGVHGGWDHGDAGDGDEGRRHDDGEDVEVTVDVHGPHGEDEEVRVVVHQHAAIPPGFWIFGETVESPEGFAHTGARLTLPQENPAWHPRAPLPAPRPGRVRCVAVGDAVYCFADGTREVLRYDPFADAWWPETSLPEAWRAFAVAELDGRIHLVGGLDSRDRVVDWHRAYHPATGRWETRAKLGSARYDMGAASLGGLLYVAGGLRAFLSLTSAAVEAYDPVADAWTGRRSMHHGRANAGVASAAGRLYVVGGRRPGIGEGRPSDKVESYDPATGRWKELDNVPTPRLDAALAELDGTLYLVGGDAGDGATGLTQAYVPGDGWVGGAEMAAARTKLGLASFSGRLLAVGGTSDDDGALSSVEECRLFYDLHGFRKE